MNEVDADGMSFPADSWIHPNDPRYKAAEPYITKYPFDPQRALAQFAEAGWMKGADGMLRSASGQLLTCEFRGEPARRATQVITNTWRSVGIDAQIEERPENLARDLQVRATFKCVEQSYRPFGRIGVQHLHSNNAMIPERGYAGANRGAYMNPDLDRLIDAFMATTSDDDRLQRDREMVQLISTDLPILHTIFEVRKDFQKTGVTGLVIKTGLDIVDSRTWNVAEWDKS